MGINLHISEMKYIKIFRHKVDAACEELEFKYVWLYNYTYTSRKTSTTWLITTKCRDYKERSGTSWDSNLQSRQMHLRTTKLLESHGSRTEDKL